MQTPPPACSSTVKANCLASSACVWSDAQAKCSIKPPTCNDMKNIQECMTLKGCAFVDTRCVPTNSSECVAGDIDTCLGYGGLCYWNTTCRKRPPTCADFPDMVSCGMRSGCRFVNSKCMTESPLLCMENEQVTCEAYPACEWVPESVSSSADVTFVSKGSSKFILPSIQISKAVDPS